MELNHSSYKQSYLELLVRATDFGKGWAQNGRNTVHWQYHGWIFVTW